MRWYTGVCTIPFVQPPPWRTTPPSGRTYDPYCCNGDARQTGDCEMIPSRTVTVIPVAIGLRSHPGDHR